MVEEGRGYHGSLFCEMKGGGTAQRGAFSRGTGALLGVGLQKKGGDWDLSQSANMLSLYSSGEMDETSS